MKIVHIQYSMPPAGNACYRLHSAMRERGIHSYVYNIKRSLAVRNYVYSPKKSIHSFLVDIFSFLHGYLVKSFLKPNSYYYSYKPLIGARLHKENIIKNADIIYLHWIAGGCLSFREIERLAKTGKIVVFFMHDMWDFTGGCHHSFDCKGYETGCRDCPMFKKKKSLAKNQIDAKYRLFSKYSNIVFVSPSQWMADCARESYALRKSKVFSISNVVDESIFKPINKNISRFILNLPQDKTIITFGCQAGTNNPYKGWKYLKDAISKIDRKDIQILVYGVDYQKDTQDQVPYPITFLGPVFDETKLSLICNATDIFVSPSLAESFGLTFLENILCGTPVVGFDNTAVNEIVQGGKTGYLANNKNAEDLAKGIVYLLNNKESFKVDFYYSTDSIINQHIRMIDSITNNNEK